MRKEIKQTGEKAISVNAIAGTYVILLSMNANDAARKGLLGFAIHRTDKTNNTQFWLKNLQTFQELEPNPKPGFLVSTQEAPIQKFVWGDYTTKPNTEYIYKVVPVYGKPKNLTFGEEINLDIKTENEDNQEHAIYFNRGAAGSQAYARKFGNKSPDDVGEEAFKWLSRGLEEAILDFIGQAKDNTFSIRAAAYEFSHEKVLNAFGAASKAGADVKIVYDARVDLRPKGPKKVKNPDGTVTITHTSDENEPKKAEPKKASDAAIAKAGIQSLMIPRASDPNYISHNKYIILLKDGKPIQVLTGSTNFTDGGIYGQSNVVHIVRDETVAAKYLEYWHLLAQDTPVAKLRPLNIANTPTPVGDIPQGIHPIFSPRTSLDALQKYTDEIDTAKAFSGFTAAFGVNKLFSAVMAKNTQNVRYVLLEKSKPTDAIFTGVQNNFVSVGAVLSPTAVGDTHFQSWVSEKLTGLNSFVKYLHTKYLLVDPLSDNPTVFSGSANFSDASTVSNDENMLVIRGNTMVADIYFGEFMRLWFHFYFRDIANQHAQIEKNFKKGVVDNSTFSAFLVDNDSWTDGHYGGNFRKTKERELFS